MRTRPAPATALRLPAQPGEVIDRESSFRFRWNGQLRTAYRGDTIISALAAAGDRVFSRSFKYHRPRGLLTASFHDRGCTVQVGEEPNVRGAHRLVEAGMDVRPQNAWPSLDVDVKAANQLVGRFLPPGFYYKTFMSPARLWPAYQSVLRQFSSGGTVPAAAPEVYFDKRYVHADVLVAGGGPAGMAAAVAAADAGARVVLVEEEHQLGGHLRWGDAGDLEQLAHWREQVLAHEGIETLTDSTVIARYDDNWVGIVQRCDNAGRERLLKARARVLVPAAGLIERPYVFEGNDLPGVMLSTAARRLINLYAVQPGRRAVVLTANASGDAAVADLERAGVEIAQVLDARRGETVTSARGGGSSGVRSVLLGDGSRVQADLLVTATGWTAPTALLNMAGDRPVYSARAARFLPGGQTDDSVLPVGGLVGDGSTEELAEHAGATGRRAAALALAARADVAAATPTSRAARDGGRGEVPQDPGPAPDLPVAAHPELFRSTTHGFVDFSEDVSSKDIAVAVAEGYDDIELVKRYTTATMGPLQGKLELVNTIAAVAEATGRSIAETGTTTWRPAYAPITLGALAGRKFSATRRSPLQQWHQDHGARLMVAGQWVRPEHYGDPAAEVRAVREGVGIIDVTPIGKLDLQGRDVPQLLNLLYTNRWSKLEVGKVRYGVMCAEDGVVLDDGITARLGEHRYLMTTTSGGAGAVWEWVEEWLQTAQPDWDVHVTPVTTAYTSINVAGPRSRELMRRLVEDLDLSADAFGYMQARTGRVAGVDDCVVWRIGFTGELSYEVHVPASYGLHVWEQLLEHGADLGIRPFGVEAQRILRLEKGHLIVGQDTDGLTKAYSAGLGWAIKLDKDDFVGKPELVWQEGQDGPRLVGVQPVDGQVVPPEASQILSDGGAILGRITSSRMSPTLGRSICLAQVHSSVAEPGTTLSVRLPDGTRCPVVVTPQLAHVDPEGHRLDPQEEGPTSGESRATRAEPVARPPVPVTGPTERIGDWEVTAQPPTDGLRITDLSPLAKVALKTAPGSPFADVAGVRHARTRRDGEHLLIGSGPGEWLVLGPPGSQGDLVQTWQPRAAEGEGSTVAVVDQTHGRALLRLTGARAVDLMAKVCAIDLSDDLVPDGSALRTSVATVVTDLVRDDLEGEQSYLLHCERSSGQYLWEALLDAGQEFGITR